MIFDAESSAYLKRTKEEKWVGGKGAGLSSRKLVFSEVVVRSCFVEKTGERG